MSVRLMDPMIEDAGYRWLISVGENLFGVGNQRIWCMRIRGQVTEMDSEAKFMPLGPLLEVNESEFSSYIERMSKVAPDCAASIREFPKENLLKYVFHTAYSSYWPERALIWLEADKPLWPKFENELRKFSTNKGMSQPARQKALAMLRNVGRM